LGRRPGEPQNRSGRGGEEKNSQNFTPDFYIWKYVLSLLRHWILVTKFSLQYFGNWSNKDSSSSGKLPFISPVLSLVGATTFVTVSHQQPFSVMYDVLSHVSSTLLTSDMIPLCAQKSVPRWWLAFHFHRKIHNLFLADCHHIPVWSLVLSLDLHYTLLLSCYCFQWTCPKEAPNIPYSKSHNNLHLPR